MTSFTHTHTKSRLGNDILVGIVEGRICFAFESQKLVGREANWCQPERHGDAKVSGYLVGPLEWEV